MKVRQERRQNSDKFRGSQTEVAALLGSGGSGTLVCEVPGTPFGKQRPRATTINGHARVYTPQRTVNAENWIADCWLQQVGLCLLSGPLEVAIEVRFQPAKSMPKRGQQLAQVDLARPERKPDWDNAAKLVCDALNGLAWFDDSQIVRATVDKRYCQAGEGPGVQIRVRPWSGLL